MLDLVQAIDQFGAGIFEVILICIEERVDDDEAVFRDGAGEDRAAALAVE